MTSEPTIRKVHADARGEMYSIAIGDRELLLLHSVKGSLRGGHSHDVPETVMVLTGEMEYHKRPNAVVPLEQTLRDGDCSYNAAGEIHMGEFTEDTWLLEWKLCKDKGSWRNHDFEPWREQVHASAAS